MECVKHSWCTRVVEKKISHFRFKLINIILISASFHLFKKHKETYENDSANINVVEFDSVN